MNLELAGDHERLRAVVDADRELIALLLDHLPDAVVLIDTDARIVWANRATERLFGIPLAAALGVSGLDFIHPDDLELAALSVGSVQGKTVGSPIELRLRTPDGWRLVEVVGAPVPIGTESSILLCLRDLTERRRWEVAGDEIELFRSLIQNAAAVTMLVSADGVVRAASAAFTRLLGHDLELAIGIELADYVVDRDRDVLRAAFEDASDPRRTSVPVTADVAFRRRGDGSPVPTQVTIVNLLDDRTVEGYVVSVHDATARDDAESELREALSLLEATFNATADGVLVVDRNNQVSGYNQRLTEIWGMPEALLQSSDQNAALSHVLEQVVDPTALLAKIQDVLEDPACESHDIVEFRDGRVFECYSRPQRVGGAIVGRVWTFHDATRRKRLEEELAQQALHDSLTGLANQALFRDRVEHALERSTRSQQQVAVLFMDLDSFKTVNDSLGHVAGDRLLVTVAQRLHECLRTADTAARLGGDEFAVLLEDVESEDEAVAVATRIMGSLRPPVLVDGNEVATSASVGIALGDVTLDSEQLLRNADLAMYTAKGRGRGRHAVFEAGMHAAAMERLELENDLRHATERGELVVLYQPIVHLGTGAIVGVEALARWLHPRRGLLNPSSFIVLAEETGMIDEIGGHVLAAATMQACAWNQDGALGGAIDVSVNLSPRQLLDPQLPEQVDAVLHRSSLRPEQLIIEITEVSMVQDVEAASRNAFALHDLGVRLAVDDFGTGYSSLSHLQRFPIDIVKIDRSFVTVVDGAAEDAALAKAIVKLAQTLGLTAIAEGVETAAQAEQLRGVGCDLAQGFHFSAPVDAAELHRLLERGPVFSGK